MYGFTNTFYNIIIQISDEHFVNKENIQQILFNMEQDRNLSSISTLSSIKMKIPSQEKDKNQDSSKDFSKVEQQQIQPMPEEYLSKVVYLALCLAVFILIHLVKINSLRIPPGRILPLYLLNP